MDFFFFFFSLSCPPPSPFSPVLSGALSRPSFPFARPKSKADTLNAMNDVDLNLWRRRVISVGGCMLVEKREGQGVWGVGDGSDRGPSASSGGQKKRKKEIQGCPVACALPGSQCALRIVKWLCYREQVNCVPLPRPLYFPPHYDPRGHSLHLPARRATASAVLLKAGLALRHCTWAKALKWPKS